MKNTQIAPMGQGRARHDWHAAHRISRAIRVTDALLRLNFYVGSMIDRYADPHRLGDLDGCPSADAINYERDRLRTHTDDVLQALRELEAALDTGRAAA